MSSQDPSSDRRRRAARRLRRLLRFYPPYLGAGVRVTEIDDGFTHVRVRMKLSWWNRNYVGTHFGGSLYSMCDPFFMLMLLEHLGPDYVVWDKAATIRFRRPGRGTVYADFHLSTEQVEEIRRAADEAGVTEPTLTVEVRDGEETLIAEVEKLLYVRRKDRVKERAS
jgi:acyl-coenzyme A thioesterase PaaI-like protein